ncbi:MAG TPA: CGNR zinc finger domain-containing protein [Pseudonocardia sp.]
MDTQEPRTADRGRFRFRAARSSLDLCSTLLWRHGHPVEQLVEPGDLGRWLAEAGLLDGEVRVDRVQLAAAIRLREAVHRLAGDRIAGRPLDSGALTVLNAAAAHPVRVPVLAADGTARLGARYPVAAALAEVARDFVEVVTGSDPGRLRECAAADCAFLFVDASRPGTRRWCAADRCANRAYARAHRRRGAGPT